MSPDRQVRPHPILAELDASLAAAMPHDAVDFSGEWVPAVRRAYRSNTQLGSGTGPFIEVIDYKWKGAVAGSAPIAGIAFMQVGDSIRWSKSQPAMPTMAVDVSLHAYTDHLPDRATFGAALAGAVSSAPFEYRGDLVKACEVRSSRVMTGRVEPIAHVPGATFSVLLFDGKFLKVGRHRLWRVRDDIASRLPPPFRELLTRKRSGDLR
jgi:hypothetical protein